MNAPVTLRRFDARPLIAASVALVGFVMFLPPLPAYAGEKSVFADVVVEGGEYEGGVSTVFGDASVYGRVDGDVHSAFGDIGVDARVTGSVNSGFGEITVGAPVTGEVDAGFGDVYVNSRVGGDIDANHGDIRLGHDARVMGYARSGSGEIQEHSGAVLMHEPVGTGMMSDFKSSGDEGLLGYLGWFFATAGFAACVVLAAVVAPRSLSAAARRAEESPGRSLLVGLVSVPAVLVLSVALAVSVVGVPLLLLMAPAYLALVFYGALVAAFFVGRKVVLATGRYRSGNA
nr:polymer-forming cytoskeletal protein [Rubrobacteraceae bacterium]